MTTSKKTTKVNNEYSGINYDTYLEMKLKSRNNSNQRLISKASNKNLEAKNSKRNNSNKRLISRVSSKKLCTKLDSSWGTKLDPKTKNINLKNYRHSPDSVISCKKLVSRKSSINSTKNPRASTGQSTSKMRFNLNLNNRKPSVKEINKQKIENDMVRKKAKSRDQSLERFFDSMGNLHYEGQTTNSLANGLGKLYFSSGLLEYNGEFKNNLLDGYGKLHNENGLLVYSGEFSEGKKYGYGIEWYANKSKLYEGKWIDDKWHGYGVWYSAEGGIISEGVFQYGKPTTYIGTNFALPNATNSKDDDLSRIDTKRSTSVRESQRDINIEYNYKNYRDSVNKNSDLNKRENINNGHKRQPSITNRQAPKKIDFTEDLSQIEHKSELQEAVFVDLEKDMEFYKNPEHNHFRNMSVSKTASSGKVRSVSRDSNEITGIIKNNLEYISKTTAYGQNNKVKYENIKNIDPDAMQFNLSSAMLLEKSNAFEYSRSTSPNREKRLEFIESPTPNNYPKKSQPK